VKLLHTADWHVGRNIKGRDRGPEHATVLAELAGVAASENVDLVLVAGDVFDSSNPSPESEQIVYRALLDLAEVAPVVVIAGNHDHPRRLQAVAPLLELGRVTVAGFVQPPDQGGLLEIKTDRGEPVFVALLPFVSQKHLVRFDQLMDQEQYQHEQVHAERVKRLAHLLCQPIPGDAVGILAAHLMMVGGTLGGGERVAHTIFDYAVPAAYLPGHLHYAALGHLHRRQRLTASTPTWYAGSPVQLDFGEETDQKGVLVVEAVPNEPAMVREVDLLMGRRLRTLTGTLPQLEELAGSQDGSYLRIVVEEASRPGLNDEVRRMFPEAVEVRLALGAADSVLARPARIGRPPGELFAEYLGTQNVGDPAVLAMFNELVEEADATDPA